MPFGRVWDGETGPDRPPRAEPTSDIATHTAENAPRRLPTGQLLPRTAARAVFYAPPDALDRDGIRGRGKRGKRNPRYIFRP